ncbi:MAG: M28 family peptidase [Actinobacteria bacterium]|nr:M28 family peptidase [Actinomycetota bacterium]
MAWTVVAVPVLVAAFTVARPEPLPAPQFEPAFDQTTAIGFATELTRHYPDRFPGSPGAHRAADWVTARLRDYGLKPESQRFTATVPGFGERELENVVAVVPGRTPETIVVMAHRDNVGLSPGANDNASGTAALLELARNVALTPPAHTVLFLSTDGGAHGGLGAERFTADPEFVKQRLGRGASIIAVVNLDSLGGRTGARVFFGGETARSAAPALVATADASVAAETGAEPRRPGPLSQLVDLAFPFSLYEQAPFVAQGIPALTVTTSGVRPPPPDRDRLNALRTKQVGALGRSAQTLVGALDESAEIARGTQSYIYFESRLLRGWTIQFVLLVALLPFLAAVIDLFARCRRRHISLSPALRSLASRLGLWIWAGVLFSVFAALGVLADGDAVPISPDSPVAKEWPVAALVALLVLSTLGWLVVRPRLVPHGRVARRDELGGHLAAMLVLAVVALVVAATNPYALLFVLPSAHAWLWLPHLSDRFVLWRLAAYAVGFAGPALLLGSFALRYDLGFDAVWYLAALGSVGYVPLTLLAASLAWGAVAAQVGSLTVGRYAPYPAPQERPVRGPIRGTIRRTVLFARARRAETVDPEVGSDARSSDE